MALNIKISNSNEVSRELKACIAGNSGTGKTYSSLMFASTWLKLQGKDPKIGIVDTENRSAANLKSYFNFMHADLQEEQASVAGYMEAVKLLLANGCNFIIIDSLTPAWSGENGVLGEANKINRGKNPTPQQWGILKQNNRALINQLSNLNVPIIVTVKSKDVTIFEKVNGIDKKGKVTRNFLTHMQYDKIIQDKEFVFYFDLICLMQREVYLTPNNEILDISDLEYLANQKVKTINAIKKELKLKVLEHYANLTKSRFEFNKIEPINKLFVAKIFYIKESLDFTKSVFYKHPDLFTQFNDPASLIKYLKENGYKFYKNDINLIEALYD